MLMKLPKRSNLGIKLSLTALFIIGLTIFGFMRSDRLGAVAASPQSTKANVAASTCGSWSVVASPSYRQSYFSSVAAISASDIWAVGNYLTNNSGPSGTLIEHWNGSTWSITPGPAIAGSSLNGVAALASNDVWAVGANYNTTIRRYQTLTEHWNGSSWSVVSSPNPSNLSGQVSLNSIVAISANDIWAAGDSQIGNGNYQTLIEHWDGTQWSIIASPNVGSSSFSNYLYGIAAVSSNNVYAVGMYMTNPGYTRQTLIEHWNGTQWSVITSPNVGTIPSGLEGVSVVSANNIWAVGFYGPQSANQPLVEHWDGSQWNVVSSPNVGSGTNALLAIKAISATNILAVGYSTISSSSNVTQTLIEHWNGTQWSVTSSSSPGTYRNSLNGIARVPGTSH